MKHRHFPHYIDDADFTTNAPSYYEDLARKEKLIRLLAERIWGYEKILDETLEEIQERFRAWDKNLEDFPDDVKALLQKWLDDGTLDHIINDTIFNWKLDTSIFEQFRDSITAQLAEIAINVSNFGAKGDGVTDDYVAIKSCHEYANETNKRVIYEYGKTYYIGTDFTESISVRTDVDFNHSTILVSEDFLQDKSVFLLDGDEVQSISDNLILSRFVANGISAISGYLDATKRYYVKVTDANETIFIRYTPDNVDVGVAKRELNVISGSNFVFPFVWDFETVTGIYLKTVSRQVLFENGTFVVHKVNTSGYAYPVIYCKRNNVLFKNLISVRENDNAPSKSSGLISTNECCDITLENVLFSPSIPDRDGTYDFSPNLTVNLTMRDCRCLNTMDSERWGVVGGNFLRNVIIDNCELSRFDTHKDCVDLTIKGSRFGKYGVTVSGHGKLVITDTDFYGAVLIFRADYGSLWDGDIDVVNCRIISNTSNNITLATFTNNADHDYGYPVIWGKNHVRFENITVNINYETTDDTKSCNLLSLHSPATNNIIQSAKVAKKFIFRNIRVNSKNDFDGFRLFDHKTAFLNRLLGQTEYKYEVGDGTKSKTIESNVEFILDDVDLFKYYSPSGTKDSHIFNSLNSIGIGAAGSDAYFDGTTHVLLPKFILKNLYGVSVRVGGFPCEIEIEKSLIRAFSTFNSGSRSNSSFRHCKFEPQILSTSDKTVRSELLSDIEFYECTFMLPEALDDTIIDVAKFVQIYSGFVPIFTRTSLTSTARYYNCKFGNNVPVSTFKSDIGNLDCITSYYANECCFHIPNRAQEVFEKAGTTSLRNSYARVPIGKLYYDTTESKLKFYNGSAWV